MAKKPKKVYTGISLESETFKRVNTMADEDKRDRSTFINLLIDREWHLRHQPLLERHPSDSSPSATPKAA